MFEVVCPKCGTDDIVHDTGCKYQHEYPTDIAEKEYYDIIITLYDAQWKFSKHDLGKRGLRYEDLKEQVTNRPNTQMWLPRHDECLTRLKRERVVDDNGSGLRLLDEDERIEQVIPMFEPLRTIYEHGPVDGCKDYAVYTMMSWCSLKEMTWPQAKDFVFEWLEETNAWERESWGESSIAELVDSKKHVHSNNLGWGDYAAVAKQEIDNSDVEPQIDASSLYGRTADEYDES